MRRERVRLLAGIAVAAAIALAAAYGLSRSAAAPAGVTDGCRACHTSPADDPGGIHGADRMGCEVCHGGDATTADARRAHASMEREPGALDTVERTCGTCHLREAERVRTSVMATGRGLIAVDRWAFGELEAPDGEQTFTALLASEDPSPAEDHLRRLCAGCHLGTRRDNRDDAVVDVGSGCAACHLGRRPAGRHPELDGPVTDERCLGCHSRSARLGLSYRGLAEVSGPHAAACEDPVTLFDGRAGCRASADVHMEAGMGCTDCHLHSELMGDGTSHAHENDALEIRCETCHGPVDPDEETTWAEVDDPIAEAVARLRGSTHAPDDRVRLGRRGTPVWNLRAGDDGAWRLTRKADGVELEVPPTPTDADHRREGHERLSCAACHSAWAPRCPTCHTRFDPAGEQWDFGSGGLARGRWIEENEGMGFGPPALGVAADGRILPAMPSMIATIEAPAVALRLFSMLDPHTTRREARTCEGCHLDPVALGLGEGVLDLSGEVPSFTPRSPDPDDPTGAVDGWVGLAQEESGASTRRGARSLDAEERARVLAVGRCLETGPPERCVSGANALSRDTSFQP